VAGVIAEVDEATVVIGIGRNAWTFAAHRSWIRRQENELVLYFG
jgi:hypothetical protein